jgi:hypothetical protein
MEYGGLCSDSQKKKKRTDAWFYLRDPVGSMPSSLEADTPNASVHEVGNKKRKAKQKDM